MGMGFKVYVAGLYGKAPSSTADDWLNSSDPQSLVLVFLRSVDGKTLSEAWTEGFTKNCGEVCESEKANITAFNKLMVDVKDGSRLQLDFDAKGVEVTMIGKTKSTGRIDSVAFRKALLSIFIGQHPPTEDLKKGLLGLN